MRTARRTAANKSVYKFLIASWKSYVCVRVAEWRAVHRHVSRTNVVMLWSSLNRVGQLAANLFQCGIEYSENRMKCRVYERKGIHRPTIKCKQCTQQPSLSLLDSCRENRQNLSLTHTRWKKDTAAASRWNPQYARNKMKFMRYRALWDSRREGKFVRNNLLGKTDVHAAYWSSKTLKCAGD